MLQRDRVFRGGVLVRFSLHYQDLRPDGSVVPVIRYDHGHGQHPHMHRFWLPPRHRIAPIPVDGTDLEAFLDWAETDLARNILDYRQRMGLP